MKWFFRGTSDNFNWRAGILSFLLGIFILVLIGDTAVSNPMSLWLSFLFTFGFPISLGYLFYKLLQKYKKVVDEQDKVKRQEFISSIDIPELAINFYETVFQKYKYTNYEERLSNFSDWIKFQSQNDRKILDSDYDSELNRMRTHDRVQNWSNKFLEKHLSPHYYPEIILFSEEQVDGTFHNYEVRIDIINISYVQGELLFSLDKEESPTFQHFGILPVYHNYSVGEDDNEDVVAEKIIKYMKKFIKKTRKLVR